MHREGKRLGLPALPIVFSVGLSVLLSIPVRSPSVTVIQKWYSYNRYPVRVVSLVPFVSLFSEKNKLNRLPVENIICPVHFWDFLRISHQPDFGYHQISRR